MSTFKSFQDLPKPGGAGKGGSRPPGPQPHARTALGAGDGPFDWGSYLTNGYFQSGGQIWPDLITNTAHGVAREWSRGGVAAHQVNRMFRKAAALKRKAEDAPDLAALAADILAFLPDAAYQAGRDAVNRPVKLFIDKNIPLANRDKVHFLKGFWRHFVSVYQWYIWESKQGTHPERR